MDANTARLSELINELLNTIWRFFPVKTAFLGIGDFDSVPGDLSSDAFTGQAKRLLRIVRALESEVDPTMLDTDNLLEYRLAVSQASAQRIYLEEHRRWQSDPGMYIDIAVLGCLSRLTYQHDLTDDRIRALESHMMGIPEMLSVSKMNLCACSPVFVKAAIGAIDRALSFFRSTIPDAIENSSLKTDILKANEAVTAALEDYARWLVTTVMPNACEPFSIGKHTYQQLLFSEHYLTHEPMDLVLVAQEELRNAQEEIEETTGRINPLHCWKELVNSLEMQHVSEDRLVSAYRESIFAAREFMGHQGLVSIPLHDELEVERTPVFAEPFIFDKAYIPPLPLSGSHTGRFWVTPKDTHSLDTLHADKSSGHCVYELPVIAVHDCYPGHHVQLMRAGKADSMLCRTVKNNLLIGGWALYCESLMNESGFFEEPCVRIFHLKNLIRYSCMAIIDVGLHTGLMEFGEAVRMLMESIQLSEDQAIAEVSTCARTPTQPMASLIGMLLIKDIRDRVRKVLGDSFNLLEFHDSMLGYGCIPPTLITQNMLTRIAHALHV